MPVAVTKHVWERRRGGQVDQRAKVEAKGADNYVEKKSGW
jgi:hypothetical protein